MTLAELLAERRHVLLDFDGPVCAVFGGVGAKNVTRSLAATLRDHGVVLPPDLAESDDPFAVLRHVAAAAPSLVGVAELRFRELEVEAVATAPMTSGLAEALAGLTRTGHTVTIVSNNSEAAVRTFLDAHDLASAVHGVVARADPDPRLLKPSPHLVTTAVRQLDAEPDECLLVGDSTTDITAAQAAGVCAVGYANKPGKHQRLASAGADMIVQSLDDLASATAAATRP